MPKRELKPIVEKYYSVNDKISFSGIINGFHDEEEILKEKKSRYFKYAIFVNNEGKKSFAKICTKHSYSKGHKLLKHEFKVLQNLTKEDAAGEVTFPK